MHGPTAMPQGLSLAIPQLPPPSAVSSSSEPVNKSFCDIALTIWNRALIIPEVNEVIQAMEEHRHESIFAHVSKMQAIIEKCGKSQYSVKWAFCGLADMFTAGKLNPESMSVRALQGKTSGSHGKGTVDLVLMRMHIRDFVTGTLAQSLNGISPEVINKVKEVSTGHAEYRGYAGFEHISDNLPGQSWRAGWTDSETALLQLLEDTIRVLKTLNTCSKLASNSAPGAPEEHTLQPCSRRLRIWRLRPDGVRSLFARLPSPAPHPCQEAVFGTTHDDTVKTGLKASKCAEDIMEMGSLASSIADIKKLLAAEKATKDSEAAPTRSVSGNLLSAADALMPAALPDSKTLTPAMKRVVEDIKAACCRDATEEELATIHNFGMKSKRTPWSCVKLLVYNSSETRMTKALLETTLGQRRGEPGKAYTGVLLDAKHLGTPITAPHIRIPTLNQTVVKAPLVTLQSQVMAERATTHPC